ncbi:unnamed protein product [Brassica rapa subsp. trilocularis]
MLLWQILSPWTYFWRRHVLLEMDGISGYSRRAQIGEILEVHMRKFEHIVVIWDWYLMIICWYKDSISANHKSGEKMRLGDMMIWDWYLMMICLCKDFLWGVRLFLLLSTANPSKSSGPLVLKDKGLGNFNYDEESMSEFKRYGVLRSFHFLLLAYGSNSGLTNNPLLDLETWCTIVQATDEEEEVSALYSRYAGDRQYATPKPEFETHAHKRRSSEPTAGEDFRKCKFLSCPLTI